MIFCAQNTICSVQFLPPSCPVLVYHFSIEEGQGYYDFYFEEAIPYWAGTFVAGSVFLGFAEIITLLQGINDKLNKAPQGDNDNNDRMDSDVTQESQTVYRFVCSSCGTKSTGWYQKCPNCGAVGKMEKLPKADTIIESNDIPSKKEEEQKRLEEQHRKEEEEQKRLAEQRKREEEQKRLEEQRRKEEEEQRRLEERRSKKQELKRLAEQHKKDERLTYYCTNCGNISAGFAFSSVVTCPKCTNSMQKTNVPFYLWESFFSDESKESIMRRFKDNQFKIDLSEL